MTEDIAGATEEIQVYVETVIGEIFFREVTVVRVVFYHQDFHDSNIITDLLVRFPNSRRKNNSAGIRKSKFSNLRLFPPHELCSLALNKFCVSPPSHQ